MLYRPSRRTLLRSTLAGASLAALGARPLLRPAQAQDDAEYELLLFEPFEFEITNPQNQESFGPGQVEHLNASGMICGSVPVSEERRSPAIWSAKGKLKRLKSGELGGWTSRINGAGDVVGWEFDSPFTTIPVVWLDGERTLLPMPEGATTGRAFGINDDGVITGMIQDDSAALRGVRWIDGEIELLSDPDGRPASSATVINNAGMMVVSFVGEGGAAYVDELWTDDGVSPITIPETDGTPSVTDLADDGTALLYVFTRDGANSWTSLGDELTELAAVEKGYSRIGFGINGKTEIVGVSWDDREETRAFRATRWIDNEPIDLNTLIPEDAGVTLTLANAINDDGMICGVAEGADGRLQGYLLVPQ